MVCPYCRVAFADNWNAFPDLVDQIRVDRPGDEILGFTTSLRYINCPTCGRLLLQYTYGEPFEKEWTTILPEHPPPRPIPPEVDGRFRADFREACLVLPLSPKASAALSRRCLQHVLREKAGVKPGNLVGEIEAAIEKSGLPAWLSTPLHAIRAVGNFSAHPMKDTATGEIVDVEPGEADWMLDLLEQLFDFYFVQPARSASFMQALNQKLEAAGKDPLELTEAPDRPALPPGSGA